MITVSGHLRYIRRVVRRLKIYVSTSRHTSSGVRGHHDERHSINDIVDVKGTSDRVNLREMMLEIGTIPVF